METDTKCKNRSHDTAPVDIDSLTRCSFILVDDDSQDKAAKMAKVTNQRERQANALVLVRQGEVLLGTLIDVEY